MSDPTLDRLLSFGTDLLAHWPASGGAIALVHSDGAVSSAGFGSADPTAFVPVTTSHLFQMGSITKSFVSVLVNQCVDKGAFSLSTDIREVLPWVDLGPGARPTTLLDLLAHTSGLILGNDGVPDDLQQLWQLRHLTRSTDATPHFHYSNAGYMLLGQAVQAVTGEPFHALVRERVFTPLGMLRSTGRTTDADMVLAARGTWPRRRDIPWAPGDQLDIAPWLATTMTDGCVLSSADEMVKYARLLLGDGEVDGHRVLSPDAMHRITTPTAPEGESVLDVRGAPHITMSRYGLGLNVESIGGHHCITHGGGMVGFQTFILVDRTAQCAVIVLTNANGNYPLAQLIARDGHGLLLDPATELPPPHDAVTATPLHESSTGEFVSDLDSEFRISVTVADSSTQSHPSPATIRLLGDDGVAALTRLWSGRYVTDHPALRTFHWDPSHEDSDAAGWTYGPHTFTPNPTTNPTPAPTDSSILGTFRSHTPWYPLLRVIARGSRTLLTAPGGVEAPEDEVELVQLTDDVWRIGSDEWLPERLERGSVVDGQAICLLRDGVVYSRTLD